LELAVAVGFLPAVAAVTGCRFDKSTTEEVKEK
jgi:hypothetical protein